MSVADIEAQIAKLQSLDFTLGTTVGNALRAGRADACQHVAHFLMFRNESASVEESRLLAEIMTFITRYSDRFIA